MAPHHFVVTFTPYAVGKVINSLRVLASKDHVVLDDSDNETLHQSVMTVLLYLQEPTASTPG